MWITKISKHLKKKTKLVLLVNFSFKAALVGGFVPLKPMIKKAVRLLFAHTLENNKMKTQGNISQTFFLFEKRKIMTQSKKQLIELKFESRVKKINNAQHSVSTELKL
jgi:hypothetical protein